MRRSRCEERLAGRDESLPTTGKRVVVKAVGGGVPDAPLRGAPFARAKPAREASPSGEVAAEQAGRVQPVDGGHSKVAGRACPAPTDCRESLCTRGAREGGSPPLPSWRVVDREWAATQGPSESPSHLTVTAPFDKGASLAPCGGSGEHPNFKTEEGSAALRTDSNTASV